MPFSHWSLPLRFSWRRQESHISDGKMKRRAEPASVEDVSDDTDTTIPNTRRTATNPERPTPKRKRTIEVLDRSRTKRATVAIACYARDPVPVAEAIRKYDGSFPMTILSGATDRDAERHEISGYRFRKLFYEGRRLRHPAHQVLRQGAWGNTSHWDLRLLLLRNGRKYSIIF